MKELKKANAVVNAADNAANVELKDLNEMEKGIMPAIKNADEKKDFDFDLETMFAREEPEMAVTISQDRIDEILRYMKSGKLTSVTLSFHQRNGGKFYLKVRFNMDKVSKTLWTPADNALAFAVMCAMRGKNDLLESYKAEEHATLETTDSIAIELFKEFMASRLRKRIGSDFTSEEGTVFKGIVFNIAKNRFVKMWVELTDEVQAIIDEACFGKVG